jgi:hypothetical protein
MSKRVSRDLRKCSFFEFQKYNNLRRLFFIFPSIWKNNLLVYGFIKNEFFIPFCCTAFILFGLCQMVLEIF